MTLAEFARANGLNYQTAKTQLRRGKIVRFDDIFRFADNETRIETNTETLINRLNETVETILKPSIETKGNLLLKIEALIQRIEALEKDVARLKSEQSRNANYGSRSVRRDGRTLDFSESQEVSE